MTVIIWYVFSRIKIDRNYLGSFSKTYFISSFYITSLLIEVLILVNGTTCTPRFKNLSIILTILLLTKRVITVLNPD